MESHMEGLSWQTWLWMKLGSKSTVLSHGEELGAVGVNDGMADPKGSQELVFPTTEADYSSTLS